MSGYWQAIERVMGENAEAARPRPRSRFEEPLDELTEDAMPPRDETGAATIETTTDRHPSGSEVPPSESPARGAMTAGNLAVPAVPAAPLPQPNASERHAAPLQADPPVATLREPDKPDTAAPPIEFASDRARFTVPALEVPAATNISAPDTVVLAEPLRPFDVFAVPTPPDALEPAPDATPSAPFEPLDPDPLVIAAPIPVAAMPDSLNERPDTPAAVPTLTIEIGEIQIRLASDAFDDTVVVPLRAASRGETDSLQSFLARQSDARR